MPARPWDGRISRSLARTVGRDGIRRSRVRWPTPTIHPGSAKWVAGLLGLIGWAVTAAVVPVSAAEARAPSTPAPSARTSGVSGGEGQLPASPAILDVFQTPEDQLAGRRVFTDYVRSHLDRLSAKRKAELAALKSPEEWKATQAKTRQRLSRIFGEFPPRTPLNARIVGKLERESYTIEKIIFESQPKYFVTANLYVPKGRKFPLPGIIFPCGHSDEGKGYDPYQMSGSGFALKGYIVLVFDPMGQGERSEYWDPSAKKHLVARGVTQHHYVRQPALLADWTLTGLRLWDGIRAVDYLESRPEVDREKLAAVGCSGGGQMSWYVTAVDERIKVCAVSHPGGSCEDSNLLGLGEEGPFKYEVQSLVAPRPIRIIGGSDSGQVPVYRKSFEDLKLFYAGLKAGMNRCELEVVPGIHSMDQNNREAAYEWLNKWFDKAAEGKPEGVIKPEKPQDLWCTESGNTLESLGGESGQTLNARRVDALYRPEQNSAKLRERINRRIGLAMPAGGPAPKTTAFETVRLADVAVRKLVYESETGIVVPALLLLPDTLKAESPVYVFASDQGKPRAGSAFSLPILLSQMGSVVLAIDVRGIGETGPAPAKPGLSSAAAGRLAREFEAAALQSVGFGQTTFGMRTLDVIRGIDYLQAWNHLGNRKLVIVGEGSGGLWAVTAAANDSRVHGVVAIGTLPSYRLLTHNRTYEVRGYFVVPGALRDFDIPDLARLASPKPQIWIDPVDALGRGLDRAGASAILGWHRNLHILTTTNGAAADIARQFTLLFK